MKYIYSVIVAQIGGFNNGRTYSTGKTEGWEYPIQL